VRLLGRLSRALGEERIRLKRAPLRVEEIRPGDWLQLGTETWRVVGWESGCNGSGFHLEPLYGTTGASLFVTRNDRAPWRLRRGTWEVEIDREELVLFPVGTTCA
jgi:hypothetical protein